VVVLIIGARWGSQAVPEFVDELTKLSLHDVDGKMSEMIVNHQISVTQLEALTAFGLGIPIFALVDENVRSEARMYEANRELADAGHLKFPTVGDSGAARFIFSFLSYIESRPTGNAIVQFRQIEVIQNHLRVQWSAMLQRLLSAAAVARREQGLVEELGERIEDLKAVLLASIQGADAKKVATGTLKYRYLCDVLSAGGVPRQEILSTSPSPFRELFPKLLNMIDLVRSPNYMPQVILLFHDYLLLLRMPRSRFDSLERQWDEFSGLNVEERALIYDALNSEGSLPSFMRRYTVDPSQRQILEEVATLPYDDWREIMGLINLGLPQSE